MNISFSPALDEDQFRKGLLRAFMSRVLDADVDDCFVSVESDCTDFNVGISREKVLEKIRQEFGADVSDIPGRLNIMAVLRRLELQ